MVKRKLLFITGTRADFGKLKALIMAVQQSGEFEVVVFATGMHMLKSYGNTLTEISKAGVDNVYPFINHVVGDHMSQVLANTIGGLSRYVEECPPDLIVIHGDRSEALGGAIVGAFNNIRVAHVEGGERSGTIDESIRHAITKFSHLHFVGNDIAKKRLVQMGEIEDNIFVIGSPNVDIMLSADLPSLLDVKNRYDIPFSSYSIFVFHPVTTELETIEFQAEQLVAACNESGDSFLVIHPNNDSGNDMVLHVLRSKFNSGRVKMIPSMRFEYYLTALKNANYIIGNSSSGLYEAPVYGIPTIDIGTRQNGRFVSDSIFRVSVDKLKILSAIKSIKSAAKFSQCSFYGDGSSAQRFLEVLKGSNIFSCEIQKCFVDIG